MQLPHITPNSWQAYGFAILLVTVAALLRWAMGAYVPVGEIPFTIFFPAVLAATFIGGLAVGSCALILSLLISWWAFLPPAYSFVFKSASSAFSLVIFVASAALIMLASEHYRRLVARLNEEEHHRSMLVGELNHRLKNKISTIYAIVGRELKNDPEGWRRVQGRLQALAATDDFTARSETADVGVLQLINRELSPYAAARLFVRVEDVRLPAKPATLLSLVLHELATNAAKYGAFSTEEGTLSVTCSRSAGRIRIEWLESGGPPVVAPMRRGFGSSVIARAMDPYDGHTEINFDPSGLRCVVSFADTAAAEAAIATTNSSVTQPKDAVPAAANNLAPRRAVG